jgi:integrase
MGKISVNQHGYLYFDFTWKGMRCREGTKLKDNPENRRRLQKKLDLIQAEMGLGVFDYARHFPGGNKIHIFGRQRICEEITFKEFANTWLAEKKPRLKASYWRNLSYYLHAGILPYFGSFKMTEIKEQDIERFLVQLTSRKGKKEKTLSGRGVNNYLTLLKEIFNSAERRKFIETNPAEFVKKMEEDAPDVDPLSMEEVKLFLEWIPVDYYRYFFVSFFTGMRPNEQIALRWQHIDFAYKKISVRVGRVFGVEGRPKTRGSVRDIDMLPPVEHILKAHWADGPQGGDYVFTNQKGTPIDPANLRNRIWYPTLEKAGIRLRSLYQTRHTFATLMLGSGENPEWVAKMLGHTTIRMLEKYSKFIPNLTRRDGLAFLRVFGKKIAKLAPKNLSTFCQPFPKQISVKPKLLEKIGGASYTKFEPTLNVKEPDRRRLGHPAASHCSSTLTPVTPLAISQWAQGAQQGGVPGYSWPPSLAFALAPGSLSSASSAEADSVSCGQSPR